jgi:subtilase family serine protease
MIGLATATLPSLEADCIVANIGVYKHNNNNNNKNTVSNMTNLDMLLLRGPSHDNLEAGLDELRYTILTEGVPANNEGMVGSMLGC